MSPEEIDEFLAVQHTCRVATMGRNGPHVAPMWFVWSAGSLWLNSIVDSRRWRELMRSPEIAVVIDAGEAFGELRGVEFCGLAAAVGEVPRGGATLVELAEPERLYARKYAEVDEFVADGRHAWLRVTPMTTSSWDFRKMSKGRSSTDATASGTNR